MIGTGAFKSVYKAYDSDEGIEVAWNQVRLIKVQPQQKAKILGEITILEQVKHEHIMEIYDSWETPDGHFVVFITEIMTMTLKEYVSHINTHFLVWRKTTCLLTTTTTKLMTKFQQSQCENDDD